MVINMARPDKPKNKKPSKIVSDVVPDDKPPDIPQEAAMKMQNRHGLMQNIQHITEIINNTQNYIRELSSAICAMEENIDAQIQQIFQNVIMPVKDKAVLIAEKNELLDKASADLDKYTEQVKSMQLQHDGYTAEIDEIMEKHKEGKK